MTDIKLELIELMSDVDLFQFIEKGMPGGVSYIANRYGKANNKYVKESSNVLYSRAIFFKIATGGLVHHYSHLLAQFDGNYTLKNLYGQFDGNYMFFSN